MQEVAGIRGKVDAIAVSRGRSRLEGFYPVAAGLDFPVRAAALSRGQARLSIAFGGYQPCDLSLGRTVLYRGISPLDRAKYILHARHAL
jgi:ribosomal protection tetracycline resistance protein